MRERPIIPELPRIRCAVCCKPVDKIAMWEEQRLGLHGRNIKLQVWCHGDKESAEVNTWDLFQAGVREVHDLPEGVAFATKRIEGASK